MNQLSKNPIRVRRIRVTMSYLIDWLEIRGNGTQPAVDESLSKTPRPHTGRRQSTEKFNRIEAHLKEKKQWRTIAKNLAYANAASARRSYQGMCKTRKKTPLR